MAGQDSPHDGAGWERLRSKADTELRPEGNMAGKGLPGRGHSLGLSRQRGKWGAGHRRELREAGEPAGKKHYKEGRSPLMPQHGGKEASPQDFKSESGQMCMLER